MKSNQRVTAPQPQLANATLFAQSLTDWFSRARRALPWRFPAGEADAYRILVSEMMLQQTTVNACIPYFQRFMERFPDLATLAAAPLDEVLALWAGLGYYTRARSLHACAVRVVADYGGVLPVATKQLMELPGIGRYTAGAVASIAYDQPVPIVEANVARVLSRVLGIQEPISSPTAQRSLWAAAEEIVSAGSKPSIVNPALMELGALICRPRQPDCPHCPVADHCEARQSGLVSLIPVVSPKRKFIDLHHVCVLARHPSEARILMRRRSHERTRGNWWRGMWELPWTAIEDEEPTDTLARLCAAVHLEPLEVEHLATVRHTVTHHRIVLECWSVQAGSPAGNADGSWLTRQETDDLAVASPMRRLLENWA